ncbi:MAG: hypothetical protein M0R03_16185 [Novosphingobium sp.]|nr:hypothetical protein [Novosphingobium sp.]
MNNNQNYKGKEEDYEMEDGDEGNKSDNPELNNLVDLLEQNPEMIDMAEKYISGVLRSQGKLNQNTNDKEEQPEE